MRVILRITSGWYEGRTVLLRVGQVVKVGRTEWADFPVPSDDHMSGVHFALRCENDGCHIEDLESTNGTLVNDERIVAAVLNNGDTIRAGCTTFVVELEAAGGASAQPGQREGPGRISTRESLAAAARVTVSDGPFVPPILRAAAASGRPYDKALVDEDPLVRREAILAAVWTRQPWLLGYCRWIATQPTPEDWDTLWLLAVLGQPSDVESVLAIGRTTTLGSRRFGLYASYGHPRTVKDLLVSMASKDPNTAVAAGVAFTKITGADVDSPQRVTLPPEDGREPDEFEKEFLEEAFLPSAENAEQHWKAVQDRFARGVRWRRGLDLSQGASPELLAQLDMEGRYEACLRGKYEGTWQGTPQQLERFPIATTR